MANPTADLEYTLAHLARLDLLLRREVAHCRAQQPTSGHDGDDDSYRDDVRGIYVSHQEADALLDRPPAVHPPLDRPRLPDHVIAPLDAAAAGAAAQIAGLEAESRQRSETFRLARLAHLFGLSDFQRDVVVVALAAELDLKYERLFGYLQDDITKKRPTVDLVLRLLWPDLPARLAARRAFDSESSLLRWQLVTLHDDPNARRAVLLARYLKLDDRVAGYLLGSDAPDHRLAVATRLHESSDGAVPAKFENWLAHRYGSDNGAGGDRLSVPTGQDAGPAAARAPVFLFHGRYGTGRRAAARALAQAMQQSVVELSAAGLHDAPDTSPRLLMLAEREALLAGALLCWSDADSLLRPDPGREAAARAFIDALARGRVPSVLLAEKPWEPARALARRPFVRLEFGESTYAERRASWTAGLNGSASALPEHELTALAGRFRLTPGQIEDALARARTLAWTRDPLNGQVLAEDIDAACRTQAQHRLGTLARKLTPRYAWVDIVLPAQELAALHLICATIRRRPTVYGEWGFDRKLAMGKGVIALFAGSSGTGKTMAAEIIARDLGLDLFKIDLSSVVNKYIGETEKNLERLFSEAQDSDAILFFDEADALFGKRSGVKDAHDRYANIETAYLLQRTEEYNGLVILASNLSKNIDDAFVRRLHFTVNFPVPDEPERLEIWRRTFPPEAPVSPDLDLPFLARKLHVSGGNIRNIILAAAFLAAEEGSSISMRHLVQGTVQEFQKLGRMVHERDFGPYMALVTP